MRNLYRLLLFCGIVLAGLSIAASAQGLQGLNGTPPATPPAVSPTPPPVVGSNIFGGYMVGVGDILDIRVANEDDVSGQYQVNQNGQVVLPLLSSPIPAAGSTTFDLSYRIAEALKKQQILREPSVTVFIIRGMNHNVTILGSVARPGVYQIEKPTTLLDLLSLAGGIQGNFGSTLTVARALDPESHPGTAATKLPSSERKLISVNLGELMSGKNPALNLQVHAGDVVTVPTAPVIYVVGSVTKPGAYTVENSQSGMTILQALAMAQGTLPVASLNHAVIVRQSSSQAKRQDIPINLKNVMRGKDKDQVLQANDVLFVPESGFKAGLHRLGDIAAQTAGQVAGYGLGLRIAH
jgi:polysaccharide biosynthesis/export protein